MSTHINATDLAVRYDERVMLGSATLASTLPLPVGMSEDALDALSLPTGSRLAYDMGENAVVLFPNERAANYFGETNKDVALSALPVQTARK